jgi:nitroreductase
MILRRILGRLVPSKAREALAILALPSVMRESFRALSYSRVEAQHARDSDDSVALGYDIRRLAHILEKGLCHPVWEPGHGRGVRDAIDSLLRRIPDGQSASEPSLVWALGILREYDEAQESGVNRRSGAPNTEAVVYGRSFVEFLRSRRSVRTFTGLSVEAAEIEMIASSVNWSPTSCNRQSARIFASLDSDKIARVATRFAGCTGFSTPLPAIMVFCSDLRAYTMPMEQYLPAIDVSLGVQACALTAHSMGLSMTLMSWAQHSVEDDRIVRDILGIPAWCQIIVGAALGRPATVVPAPGRKDLKETLAFA